LFIDIVPYNPVCPIVCNSIGFEKHDIVYDNCLISKVHLSRWFSWENHPWSAYWWVNSSQHGLTSQDVFFFYYAYELWSHYV